MGTTTNRGFPYPERSDDPDVHADMKALADAVDVDMTTVLPVGSVIAYAGSTPPSGWLLCDGNGFNSTTYPVLESVLGSAVTPNLVERFVKGVSSRPSTKTGGSKKITTQNMPSHSHGGATAVAEASHSHGGATHSGNATHLHYGGTTTNGDHTHGINLATRQIYAAGGSNNAAYNVANGTGTNSSGHGHFIQTDTQNAPHQHGISQDAAAHAHGISAEGGGTDYEPQFYALLYIVKAR